MGTDSTIFGSKYLPGLPITISRPVSASGYRIMLTSLSQFQAQGWEKWLSRITFTRGTNSLKSTPIGIKSYPAITVLSPDSGYVDYSDLNYQTFTTTYLCKYTTIAI
jgi:hypothetical protein